MNSFIGEPFLVMKWFAFPSGETKFEKHDAEFIAFLWPCLLFLNVVLFPVFSFATFCYYVVPFVFRLGKKK